MREMFDEYGLLIVEYIGAAILIVLGFMFYWAAYKIYKDPKLAKKNKKSVVQQMTDPNYKNTMKNNKKKR